MSDLIACGARADVRKLAAATAPARGDGNGVGAKARGTGAVGSGARVFGDRASRVSAGKPSYAKASEGNRAERLMARAVEQGARLRVEDLQGRFPHVVVPKLGVDISLEEWFWKEMKEGGVLHEYLRQEKALTQRRYRKVARKMHGFQQNNKSDVRMIAAVPARDYFRWKAVDKHFFEDDSNLRSLRRDNPDVVVKL